MKTDLIIAGVGGQGILTVAGLIAQTALEEGLNVKQSEVHGMAQRGGAVEAHLRLSSAPVFSDLVPLAGADVLCGMEPLEALRQLRYLSSRGWVVTNSEPVANVPDYPPAETVLAELRRLPRVLVFPATQLAEEAGSRKAANTVILGAVSILLPLPEAAFLRVIAALFRSKGEAIVTLNRAAFAAGRELARQTVCP